MNSTLTPNLRTVSLGSCPSPGAIGAAERLQILSQIAASMPTPLPYQEEAHALTAATIIENVTGLGDFLRSVRIEGESVTRLDHFAAVLRAIRMSPLFESLTPEIAILEELLRGLQGAYHTATFVAEVKP